MTEEAHPAPDQELRGELRDDLVRAMRSRPGARRPRAHASPRSRAGITNRNFLVAVAGARGSLRHPARRQRHPPARHQPRGRARRDGRRGRRRRRAGGHGLHPARGLPRDPVHRGLAGQRRGRPSARRRSAGSPIRSAGSTTVRPSRACSCRSGSSRRTGRWPWPAASAIPPEYDLASAIGRRIELACLAEPVELRPCHNDLLNANFIDDGAADPDRRLGVRRDGRPVLRPRQLQHQPRADRRRGRPSSWRPTTGHRPRPARRGPAAR